MSQRLLGSFCLFVVKLGSVPFSAIYARFILCAVPDESRYRALGMLLSSYAESNKGRG